MSDLIDREQAKDAIDKYLVGRNLVTDGTFMARLINEIVIDRLPSAQPTFDARDTQYNLPIGTDAISRADAIEAVQNRHIMLSKEKVLLINDIEKLPSAQPERIKGRWEQDGHHIKCDQCGEWMCDRDREGWNFPKNYCPNCGAEMEATT